VVRRLSVAVLVDGVWENPADGGAAAFRERTPEELARIAALVRSAVGFDERRGDTVEVVSLRFAEPPQGEPAAPGMFDLRFSSTTLARLMRARCSPPCAMLAILLRGAGDRAAGVGAERPGGDAGARVRRGWRARRRGGDFRRGGGGGHHALPGQEAIRW